MSRPAAPGRHAPAGPAVRWIISRTGQLLPPLLLAGILACLRRLVSLEIYYIAGLGLVRAAGLEVQLPGAGLGYPALAGWLAGLALGKGVLRYAEQFVGHRVAFLALARLRSQVYADYERQAPFAAGARSGAMLQRAVRDIDRIEVFYAHTLPPALAAVVLSLFVTGWAVANANPVSGLILLAGYLLLGIVVPALGLRRIAAAAGAEAAERRTASARLADALAGAQAAFSLGAGPRLAAGLEPGSGPAPASGGWVTGVRTALVGVIPWLTALVLLLAGAGQLPPGSLLMLLVIAVPSFESVRAVDGFVGSLQESLHAIKRLHANHLTVHPVRDPAHPQPPAPRSSGLEVAGLAVVRQGRPVVDGVDFTVRPGHRVALVGASGSGKSTVAAALLRAVESTGRVALDGVDTAELALATLRTRVVLAAQDDSLVRGTLRENLVLGRAGVSDAVLIELLGRLGLGPWLAAQPAGLQTRLGERGARISGGQRQRVMLARALLRDPQVLVLDEATSALDAHTEQLVLAELDRRVAAGMGLVMISHRLGLVQDFDTVLVLQDGRIVERGAGRALLADAASLFRKMRWRELESIDAGGPRD